MSFLTRDSQEYINIKLTDRGRQLFASGQLTFDRAVVSDREMNYSFNRRYPYSWMMNPNYQDDYHISGNTILSPKDSHPSLPSFNYDESSFYDITSNIQVNRVVTTAQTETTGLWSAVTSGTKEQIGSYILDTTLNTGFHTTNASDFTGGTILDQTFTIIGSTAISSFPGTLVYCRFNAAVDAGGLGNVRAEAYPMVSLWYRSFSGETMDRNLPFIAPDSGPDQYITHYYYPYNAIDVRYGTGATGSAAVWNLNITRTSREIGLSNKAIGANTGETYANYASASFAGAKKYFGFGNETRQVGFIHYSNQNTGQTYWDSLQPGSVEVDIPDLMWHRTRDDNGNLYTTGNSMKVGHRFTDFNSEIYFDESSQANYTLLKDRPSTGDSITVGRVYYDLKTIVITDPELLTAMTYKSNRNWTLPAPQIKAVESPKPPFSNTSKPGFMKKNFNYYVTYLPYINDTATGYSNGTSFGYQPVLPCQYLQKLSGDTDENGNHKHLWAQFPAGGFPHMRTFDQFESLSGTGWGCTKIQFLVQEIHKNKDEGIDSLHPGKWSGCSSLTMTAVTNDPAGVYQYSSLSDLSINQTGLTTAEFIISQADITSGNTLADLSTGATNNLYSIPNTLLGELDYSAEYGLSFGCESFFNGNIKAVKRKELFQTFITLIIQGAELNESANSTYDPEQDEHPFITEIGILNEDNELVAVGKPNYPIAKENGSWKVLQLKLEF